MSVGVKYDRLCSTKCEAKSEAVEQEGLKHNSETKDETRRRMSRVVSE